MFFVYIADMKSTYIFQYFCNGFPVRMEKGSKPKPASLMSETQSCVCVICCLMMPLNALPMHHCDQQMSKPTDVIYFIKDR